MRVVEERCAGKLRNLEMGKSPRVGRKSDRVEGDRETEKLRNAEFQILKMRNDPPVCYANRAFSISETG